MIIYSWEASRPLAALTENRGLIEKMHGNQHPPIVEAYAVASNSSAPQMDYFSDPSGVSTTWCITAIPARLTLKSHASYPWQTLALSKTICHESRGRQGYRRYWLIAWLVYLWDISSVITPVACPQTTVTGLSKAVRHRSSFPIPMKWIQDSPQFLI